MKTVQFELNGKSVSVSANEDEPMLWVIRQQLGLTGTKFGCGSGFCGSCTVIMNGEAVRSCTLPAIEAAGTKVLTIEGLSSNGELHPLQEEFVKSDALQCGFCTPGMIMNAYGLLLKNPEPTNEEVVIAMDENLCRCGAHGRIIQAIQNAGKQMKKSVAP
ncbi:MAG: (2Fe-2S)-binding protein [Bacteroidetes bacterium]|nr:MAG: (2Fe-2S)-binding protein [Bacteroidota bacterium]RLD71642.1 MAG: (2Fe-2S)-binding protein [Bacteroidota bacterium]RLD93375.1 MAG: (2Fe-2S)-binding protein [Bacteroidota bacterium]